MTVNDIRPKKLDKGKKLALEADLSRLRNWKKDFIEVDCPACNMTDRSFAFEKYSFQFSECNNCRTVYMTPRATPEILNEFYANSELYDYWNKYIFPATQDRRRDSIFKPRVQKIIEYAKKFNVGKRGLLEVGAGFGTFCEEMNKEDYFKTVIAVEPGKSLAESCRKAGVRTIEEPIENITNLDVPIDLIVAFEVIEHLFSPISFLKSCHQLMELGGMIAITCPNFKGLDIMTLVEKSDSIDAEHINMMNPESIQILFELCGFEVLECITPGRLDVDILRNAIIEKEYDISEQPFLETVLIDRWEELGKPFQKFLQENKLSSNMWIVGRKK